LIERLDLDTGRRFHEYSSGNKRKVVLIQAFMHRPRLLILDEPTSGLDPLNQQEFAHMVREARDGGSTVFLSSHILSEVEELCSQVGIIRDGRMIRVGSVADIKGIKRYEITITFGAAVAAEAFAALDGVTRVEPVGHGHSLRIEMQGAPDAVIKAAALHPVVSLSTHEPTLEHIFLRYYEGDARPAAVAHDVA
jgi:ABC-2 type transport system ATP-binding protein